MIIPITHIPCRVIPSYVYDGDTTKNHDRFGKSLYLSGDIVAVSSYHGQPLTFNVMLEGQYLYCDLPVMALAPGKGNIARHEYSIKDLSTYFLQDPAIEIYRLKSPSKVAAFIGVDWHPATYHLSADFTNDNAVLHLLECPFGFALVPNYRLNWKGDHALADYRKNRTVWGSEE